MVLIVEQNPNERQGYWTVNGNKSLMPQGCYREDLTDEKIGKTQK